MSQLVECKSCGHRVDPSANTCPSCGVSHPGIKGWKGCLFVVLFSAVIATYCTVTGEPPKPLTPAEQRKADIEKYFSPWDGSHRTLTKLIKSVMKDPDSYKHVKTTYIDKGDYLIVEQQYRGTNSFGAVIPNTVVAKTSIDGNILEILKE
jgi:RNA polymerase subunit RPABC4/transcription elongation factor Spt4